jgi:hypothetical protein
MDWFLPFPGIHIGADDFPRQCSIGGAVANNAEGQRGRPPTPMIAPGLIGGLGDRWQIKQLEAFEN